MLSSFFPRASSAKLVSSAPVLALLIAGLFATEAAGQSHSGVRYRVEQRHVEQLSDKGLDRLVPYSEAVASARRAELRARSAEREVKDRLDEAKTDAAIANEDLDLARAMVRAARLTNDPAAVAEARTEEALQLESRSLVDKRIRWLESQLQSERAAVALAVRVVWLRETEFELARAQRLWKEGARAAADYRLASFEDQTERFRRGAERAGRSAARCTAKSAKLEQAYRQELASLREGLEATPGS